MDAFRRVGLFGRIWTGLKGPIFVQIVHGVQSLHIEDSIETSPLIRAIPRIFQTVCGDLGKPLWARI